MRSINLPVNKILIDSQAPLYHPSSSSLAHRQHDGVGIVCIVRIVLYVEVVAIVIVFIVVVVVIVVVIIHI